MLKPTIVSFVNFYFIDSFVFNVLTQVAVFAWDYNSFEKRYKENPTKEIVSQAVQLVIGIFLAQVFRWFQKRHHLSWKRFFSLIEYNTVLGIIVTFIAIVSLIQYDNKIHDAPYRFSDPFPIGIFRAMLWYVTLFFILEIFQEAMLKNLIKEESAFTFNSKNTVAMTVGLLICFVDLCISNAWVPVLILFGFFLIAPFVSAGLSRLFAV